MLASRAPLPQVATRRHLRPTSADTFHARFASSAPPSSYTSALTADNRGHLPRSLRELRTVPGTKAPFCARHESTERRASRKQFWAPLAELPKTVPGTKPAFCARCRAQFVEYSTKRLLRLATRDHAETKSVPGTKAAFCARHKLTLCELRSPK